MKNVLKRSLSVLLAITIIFSSAFVGLGELDFNGLFAVRAEATSIGECGYNLTWTLYNNSTLIIRGTGSMRDYGSFSSAPWYYARSSIKLVVVYSGVTSIGEYAFSGCTSLTSITIPDSVTSIGGSAFRGCTSLTSITIPDSVTSIDGSAFLGCTSLTSVTIPDSVTSIGSSAFANTGYYNNESNWVDDVLYIGNHLIKANGTFSGEYSIKPGTKAIADYAFYSCTSLTTITIPDSVTSIGSSAFEGCTSLTSITIGEGVTSIGGNAFRGCTSLTSVTIPDSVTSIVDYAFYNCTGLTSIIIGEGVTSIGDYAFGGCRRLEKINWNAKKVGDFFYNNSIFYFAGEEGSGIELVFGDAVERIPEYICGTAYYSSDRPKITTVTISDSVISIGESAFSYCKSLTSVTIGEGVTSIGDSAFEYCTSLTSITVPDSVSSIGDDTFRDCKKLASVTIGSGVTSIGETAFYNTEYYNNEGNWENGVLYIGNYLIAANMIEYVDGSDSYIGNVSGDYVIKPGTKTIAGFAFYNCTSLTSITIPDSVTSIGESAFSYCKGLNAVYIKDLSSWCNIDFYNASANPLGYAKKIYINNSLVTEAIIPDSVTSIGDYAFYNCIVLVSITIPDSVTSIGYYAFYNCTSLSSITIPDSVASIGYYAFYNCTSLSSITIPDSVTSIGDRAFYNCTMLNVVNIKDLSSWCNIDFQSASANPLYYAKKIYINNSLVTEAIIPDSVTSIGRYAFYSCTSLTSITIPDAVTSIGYGAFRGCTSLTSVTIPDSVTSIVDYAFYNCTSLTSITIPNSVTSIGRGAFYNCARLERINWNAKSVGDFIYDYDVFYNAGTAGSGINLVFGDTVEKIPAYICHVSDLSYCPKITSVTIGEAVTSIGKSAFDGCKHLEKINWNAKNVGEMGSEVFRDGGTAGTGIDLVFGNTVEKIPARLCSDGYIGKINVVSITIPDSVTSIGYEAFRDTRYYKKASNWENGVLYIGKHLIEADYTISGTYEIKPGTKIIANFAFGNCHSLTGVTIPDSVTNIGDSAFNGCESLRYVFYDSTEEQWSNVNIGQYNNYLTKAIIHYELSGHKAGEWIVDIPATCTEKGEHHRECVICGEFDSSESIPQLPHKTYWKTTKDATCLETGTRIKMCETCGNQLEIETIPVTGHTSSSWITDKKATVNAAGEKHKECTVCGETVEKATVPQLKCSKPTIKTIANKDYGVRFEWKAVSGADSYKVYRKLSGGSYEYIGKTTKTAYADKTAKSGKKYYYVVKAVNEAGSSEKSASKGITFVDAPTIKTPTTAKSGITVKWSKVSGAEGYIVYRKTGSGSYERLAKIKGGTKVSYLDKTAKKGKTYSYKLVAYKGSTKSAGSAVKTIKDKY